jgi:uncharacterized protein involved in outer membrane biogenesis
LAIITLLAGVVLFALLALIDSGALDQSVARYASMRLHRNIRFAGLDARLVSFHPSLTFRGLIVDNPSQLHGGYLAKADVLRLWLDPWALWHASVRLRDVSADGLDLHLIRFAPRINNWTFSSSPGNGPAFEPLRGVRAFQITNGHIDLVDHGRDLHFVGHFKMAPAGKMPFALRGNGTMARYPITANIVGGPIHGVAVGRPWPLSASMTDGATQVHANGTSGDAFNLTGFDFALQASGPNLADLGYLFHLLVPNSAPYRLEANAHTDGTHYLFNNITGVLGASVIRGEIRSDHGEARRRIDARFNAQTLTRADIETLLAPIPPRVRARSTSGAVQASGTGRWLLPDAPFGLARLRAADFTISLTAAHVSGFALPLEQLETDIELDNGSLRFTRFRSRLYGGFLEANASLDGRRDVPRLAMIAKARGVRLIETPIGQALGPNARTDFSVDVKGDGRSVHEAAGRATGLIDIRATGAVLPRRAAWILGGDLLRAVGASASSNNGAPITCAAMTLQSSGSPFEVRRFRLSSPLGSAVASGTVDLGAERMHILLQGRPAQKRLFQVATPILLDGPLARPTARLLPSDHARKLGLTGKVGVLLSPLAGLIPMGHNPPSGASTNIGCEETPEF